MVELAGYSYGQGLPAMAASVKGLAEANYPSSCNVYSGLRNSSELSTHHAEATLDLAKIIVGTKPHFGYRYNSKAPPTTRIFTCASQHRLDGITPEINDFPSDLSSSLFVSVREQCDESLRTSTFSPLMRETASELMLRLGYIREAAKLVHLPESLLQEAPPTDQIEISVEDGVGQFHVLSRAYPNQRDLAELFFRCGHDKKFSNYQRSIFLKNFVVYFGQRKTWDSRLPAVAERLINMLGSVGLQGHYQDLYAQTVYRALAFIPFLQRNIDGALDLLDKGLEHQNRANIEGEDALLWRDHAFPLFETLCKTTMYAGKLDQAYIFATKLTDLSPGDYRAWIARADVLMRLNKLHEASADLLRAESLGGRHVAAAKFGLFQIALREGEVERAGELLAEARTVDPLSSSLSELSTKKISDRISGWKVDSHDRN